MKSTHLLFALFATVACGDDGDTSPRPLTGECGSDADCQTGLICEYRLCHQACTTDSTCPGAQRCVRGVEANDAGASRRICQLDESTACTGAVDCLGKQVCSGGECRDECTSDRQCASDQTCSDLDRCYSKDPAKDPAQSGS